MTKKVLITGGAGFIGINLITLLTRHEYEISVLDNFSVGTKEALSEFDVKIFEGDVRDKNVVADAVSHCNMIVHLAAQTNVMKSIEDPVYDASVNVVGTLTLLDELRKNGGEGARFVMASSNAPIGDQPPPAREDKAPRPLSPYGASKMAGEGYCCAFNGSYGIQTAALRFSNCYGPLSGHKTSVVAKFMGEILSGQDITIYGDGSQTRDFIYVQDLCNAVRLALESKDIGGRVIHVATGTEVSVGELAEKIIAISGTTSKVILGEFRRGEIIRNYSDITVARTVLGYEPQFTLDEGLKATWDWFVASRK